jgi:hypothetical protein
MPKTLMQSVMSELQKERKRLEDELHRVTAALTAYLGFAPGCTSYFKSLDIGKKRDIVAPYL